MLTRKFLLILSLIFCVCSMSSQAQDFQFEKFLVEEWERQMTEHPEWATYQGDHRFDDKWTDKSLKAIKKRKGQVSETLKKLKGISRSRLSKAHQLNYDLYMYKVEQELRGLQFPDELLAMDQMSSWMTGRPRVIEVMPRNTAKDFENILSRLEKLPSVLDQEQKLLEAGLKEGITPPQVTLKPIFEQFKVLINKKGDENPFMVAFKEKPKDLQEQEFLVYKEKALRLLNEKLIPRFKAFRDFFSNTYFKGARQSLAMTELPQGKKWYEYQIQTYTTTKLSADEIHQLGMKEVNRIRGEMLKVLKQVKFKGSLEQFNEFLRKDSRFYFKKAEDLLDSYRAIAKRADPELMRLFGKLPRTPYGVVATPDYMAPGAPTAYYMEGNQKSGRAGYFFANTYNLKSRPKYEMEALTLHEAVPGHHLQISLAQEMENVPEFRKQYFVTAFIEGWGLYAESLGEDMGFYKDPYSKYGQLTYEMWRAIRLVVDTGIHSKGWSRQQAIDFFIKNSGKTQHDIEVEVDRYIVWPGQALAYKIGELKMQELKAKAKSELKEKFDIRKFHDELLGQGALPLDLLESRMLQWIKKEA